MKRTVTAVLAALALLLGLLAAASPANAYVEHCSSLITVDQHHFNASYDVNGADPYVQIYYRHCGDGAPTNQQYYYRMDQIRYGVDNGDWNLDYVALHYSLNDDATGAQLALGSDHTTSGWNLINIGCCGNIRVTHPNIRWWQHIEWTLEGALETQPTPGVWTWRP